MKDYIPAGQYSQSFNTCSCIHMEAFSCVCYRMRTPCVNWLRGEDCSDYINRNKAVRWSSLPHKLGALIHNHLGEMIFIERESAIFSESELKDILDLIVLREPRLFPYISVDMNSDDVVLTVYEKIVEILY